MKQVIIAAAVVAMLGLGTIDARAQSGALTGGVIGGATGAVIGGAATRSAGGAVAGGIIGAAGGAIIGNEIERSQRRPARRNCWQATNRFGEPRFTRSGQPVMVCR